MSDVIADYVLSQYNQADRNRRDIQLKWETNRRDFEGNLFPDTEKPLLNPQWKKKEGEGWRSTTFPSATHQKVMAALAVVMDTTLAGGAIPFMLKPSPFNRWRARVGGIVDPQAIQESIQAMTDLITQQLVDCEAERSFMKNMLACALYGWTYAKMVVKPVMRSGFEAVQMPPIAGVQDWSRVQTSSQWKQWEEQFNAPWWVYVPCWDIFRDWETDDLFECGYVLHRQIVNNFFLKGKKGKPFFIDEKLDQTIQRKKTDNLKSSPTVENNEDTSNMSPVLRNYILYRQNPRQLLEYWGRVPREYVEEFERDNAVSGMNTKPFLGGVDDGDEIEVCAWCLEGIDTVRFVRTDPKMRPFVQAKWEDAGDEWMPRGVADNCAEMQNVLRGTFRAIEDNIKIAGNVTLAVKERMVKNMPKDFVIGQKILLAEECQDARQAISQIQLADMSQGLIGLFNLAKQQLDEDSMVPKVTQGLNETTKQTAQEAAIKQAQAQKYLGMAIRNIDNGLIEPMIKKFYEYDMNDPTVEQGKGNYIVQALGFTSFQNKTERMNKLQQSLQMALANPKLEAETKIRVIWEEIQKALDFDPDQILKTPEERQQDMERAMQMPQAQLAMQGQAAIVDKDKSVAEKNRADAEAKLAQAHNKTLDAHAKTKIMSQHDALTNDQLSMAGQVVNPPQAAVAPAIAEQQQPEAAPVDLQQQQGGM